MSPKKPVLEAARRIAIALIALAIASPAPAQVPPYGYRIKLEGVEAANPPTGIPFAIGNYAGSLQFTRGESISIPAPQATGGTLPYTVTVSGNLPAGTSFDGTAITGTANATGTTTATFKASAAAGASATVPLTVTVNAPGALAIAASLPTEGMVGVALPDASVSASGGLGPYAFAASGTPMGVGLAGSAFGGTPSQAGTFQISVTASDSQNPPDSKSSTSTLTVYEPFAASLAATPQATAAVGEAIVPIEITTSGGKRPYAYTIASGALPQGLSVSSGTLSGTPEIAGDYSFSIRASESFLPSMASQTPTLTMKVYPSPLTMAAVSPLPASIKAGQPLPNRQFLATGGTAPYTYAPNGSLPTGVTLSSGGALSGTPEEKGSYAFTVTATDSTQPARTVTSQGLSFAVTDAMTLTAAATATTRANVTFAHPFTLENGGPAPALTATASIPGVNAAVTGLSGKPTTPGTYAVTYTVTDTADESKVTAQVTVTVTAGLDIALAQPGEASVGRGTEGVALSPIQASAVNGRGTQTFANVPVSGAMTTLASLNLAISPQGQVTGTPNGAYSGPVNIRMTEVDGGVTNTVDKVLSLSIGQGPNASQSVPTVIGTIGNVANTDATARFYDNSTATFGYVTFSGALTYTFAQPTSINGLKVMGNYRQNFSVKNMTTGVVTNLTCSNSPPNCDMAIPASTSRVWEVRASRYGNEGFTGEAYMTQMKLTYSGAAPTVASVTGSTSPFLMTGQAMSLAVASADSTGATFAYTGALPSGVTMDPSTGTISGTPTQYGDFTVNVTATNATGVPSVPAPVTLKVRSSDLASAEIPDFAGVGAIAQGGSAVSSEFLKAASYDANGSFYFINGAGASVTMTFSKPVTADRVLIQTNGNYASFNSTVKVTAVDTGTVTYSTGSGYAMTGVANAIVFSGQVQTSRVWKIELDRQIAVSKLQLAYGSEIPPSMPSFANTPSNVSGAFGTLLTRNQSYASVNAVSADYGTGSSSGTWTKTGTLPPGMDIDGATGVISGTPTATGSYTYGIAMQTARGAAAPAGPFTITVASEVTVATVAPSSFSAPSVTTNGGTAYANAYDASASTTLTIPNGASLTLTFPEEVSINGFKANWAYNGCASTNVKVRLPQKSNQVVLDYNLYSYGTVSTYPMASSGKASGTVFEIFNGSPCALTFSSLALTYDNAAKYP